MPAAKPRIQVTLDSELTTALAELGGAGSRSCAVPLEFLQRLDAGEDEGYDFAVSERLHAERR